MVKIVLHEDFSSSRSLNDISLLKLASPLEFNDYVNAIPIPAAGETFEGYGTVTGWGTLSTGGISPDVLQKVDVPLVSDKECRQAYGDTNILDSMMCAGEEGKDSCLGDIGGPMACDGKLCGIVSSGRGCGYEGFPGVYTEVAYFVDWIIKNAA